MKSVSFEEYIENRKRYRSLKANFHSAYIKTEKGKREEKVEENLKSLVGFLVIAGVIYYACTSNNEIVEAFREALPK